MEQSNLPDSSYEGGKVQERKKLYQLIPDEIHNRFPEGCVLEAGWAAGPSFIVRKTRKFQHPATLDEACAWLEEYRHIFKACHILLEDNSVIWMHRNSFNRYDRDKAEIENSGCFIQVGDKKVNIRLEMEPKQAGKGKLHA